MLVVTQLLGLGLGELTEENIGLVAKLCTCVCSYFWSLYPVADAIMAIFCKKEWCSPLAGG